MGENKNTKYILDKVNGHWLITDEEGYYNPVNNSNGNIVIYINNWNVSSSSTLKNYTPENVLDDRPKTSWVEGVKGDGSGEWIKLSKDTKQEVSGIEINNGYADTSELYFANNRVKTIQIELSDGSSFEKELKDNQRLKMQSVDFGKSIKTIYIKITITGVYKGSKYDDTCISEIKVY